MNELTTAIYTRSQVSSNFKTSIGGRFYFVKAADAATYPYVVYFILSDKPEYYLNSQSTNASNFENFRIVFNVHSNIVSSSSEAGTILGYLKTHFDDCDLTVTGWNDIKIERRNTIGPFWDQTIGEWIYSVEYEIILQKS
ncbi:MAG: hypothetical protein ACYC5G_02075 [Candidatus Doudnabacteria bacterium]